MVIIITTATTANTTKIGRCWLFHQIELCQFIQWTIEICQLLATTSECIFWGRWKVKMKCRCGALLKAGRFWAEGVGKWRDDGKSPGQFRWWHSRGSYVPFICIMMHLFPSCSSCSSCFSCSSCSSCSSCPSSLYHHFPLFFFFFFFFVSSYVVLSGNRWGGEEMFHLFQ